MLDCWMEIEAAGAAMYAKQDAETLNRSPDEVTARLDALIAEIREKYHRPAFDGQAPHGDVVIVAHGHILRAFAQRWTGSRLDDQPAFIMEAGGVGTLRYVLSLYTLIALITRFSPSWVTCGLGVLASVLLVERDSTNKRV